MSLMDDFQSGRSFKIRINDHDVLLAVGVLVQYIRYGLAEYDSVGVDLLGTADMEVRVWRRPDSVIDCCDSPKIRDGFQCMST